MQSRDGIHLQLRVGLNSGEVIAGEIGSSPWSYTAVGHQVGMAQRMESVAPPGGVMLSESTARLVAHVAELGEPRKVHIKGADEPVRRAAVAVHADGAPAHQPVGLDAGRPHVGAGRPDRRCWISRRRAAAAWCGWSVPAGIGKSRIVAETAASAAAAVWSGCCRRTVSRTPARSPSWWWRGCCGRRSAWMGIERPTRRGPLLRDRVPGADEADRVLLDDALGIRDPADELPDIAPDARRRRLTALVSAAALASDNPRRLRHRRRPLDRSDQRVAAGRLPRPSFLRPIRWC